MPLWAIAFTATFLVEYGPITTSYAQCLQGNAKLF